MRNYKAHHWKQRELFCFQKQWVLKYNWEKEKENQYRENICHSKEAIDNIKTETSEIKDIIAKDSKKLRNHIGVKTYIQFLINK